MPERDVEHIDRLLATADESAWTGSGGAAVDDANRTEWERLRSLGVAAGTVVRGPEPHLTDADLARLVIERRAQGEAWKLPEHLWDCPQCLEAFDVLSSNPPPADAAALARFDALWRPLSHGVLARIGSLMPRRGWAAVAAAIVIAATMSVVVYANRPLARIGSGDLVLADGKLLAQDDAIPLSTMLIARDNSKATFRDGSQLGIDRGSRFVVTRAPQGGTLVQLDQGAVDASVTKRQPGETFGITTPIARVEVIGTQFRVALLTKREGVSRTEPEPGTITGAAPDERIVGQQIVVREGVVRISTSADEARVTAGQTAEILADSRRIVVTATPTP